MRLFEGTQWDMPPRCDRCEKSESDCQCPPVEPDPVVVAPEQQRLKIRIERRKRGKIVTVIAGVANDSKRSELLTDLKNLAGCGGTIRDDHLEIQGDHVEAVSQELLSRGYRIAGG